MESSIGAMQDGVYHLRGTPLPTLVQQADFVSTLWLSWTGTVLDPRIKHVIEACMVASIDNGAEPPSAHTARVVASAGKPLADSVAAGLLTLGVRHGNAASAAARWVGEAVASGVSAEEVIADFEEHGQRVPGIGHPVYEVDPRTNVLFDMADDVLPIDKHMTLIREVSRLLSEKKGKPMPVNVDGAIGTIVATLGVAPEIADALFLTARTAGLVSHAREASQSSSYLRG
jgi:citrate synthase